MAVLLDINNLTVKIADKTCLSNIRVQFNQGDYLCILGANGAGKSTLLKVIMGIISSYSGDIILNNQPISELSQKQRAQTISYVPQAHNHALHFNVDEFIKMARYVHNNTFSHWSKADQQAFDHATRITQTHSFLNQKMSTLSGGERQRVMIAAAVCQQSPLLLLDEPTSFLDPHHQVEVHKLITELNQQHNISIIEVSHDLNHAVHHSQHILALKQGSHLWYGQSNLLFDSETLGSLYDQHFVFALHPETGQRVALASEQF